MWNEFVVLRNDKTLRKQNYTHVFYTFSTNFTVYLFYFLPPDGGNKNKRQASGRKHWYSTFAADTQHTPSTYWSDAVAILYLRCGIGERCKKLLTGYFRFITTTCSCCCVFSYMAQEYFMLGVLWSRIFQTLSGMCVCAGVPRLVIIKFRICRGNPPFFHLWFAVLQKSTPYIQLSSREDAINFTRLLSSTKKLTCIFRINVKFFAVPIKRENLHVCF